MIFSLMQFHKNFTIVGISKTILKGGSLYLLHYSGFDWCVDTQRLMMLFIEKLFKLSYTAAQMHSGLVLEKNT